jgi:hypothetical protein
VSVTLAWFAGVVGIDRGRSPGFLDESWTAALTLVAARVVLTATDESRLVVRVVHVTTVGVAVTHASTADRDVLDAVVVPSRDGGVLSGDGHQMTEECLGAK